MNGSVGRNMMEDRFLKRLRKKAKKGLRGWPIATIAFYGPNLSQATKVTVGIVPKCRGERVARLEGGPRRHPCRPRCRQGGVGVYRAAPSGIGRDDRLDNRLPSPRRNRLRRRMVSSLRVLARTRSLYGADGPLDSRCSYRRGHRMSNRRNFITLLGGVFVFLCMSADAQEG